LRKECIKVPDEKGFEAEKKDESVQPSSEETGTTKTSPSGPGAFFRSRNGVISVLAVAVIAVAAIAFATSGGQDAADRTASNGSQTSGANAGTNADPETTTSAPAASSGEPKPGQLPKQPDGQLGSPDEPTGRAVVPVAAEGSELASVPTAPHKTLSRVMMPDGVKSGTYTLKFQPYGWAPSGPEGPRLVVYVTQSKSSIADLTDLTDRNMLLITGSSDGEPIKTGGNYEGVVEIRADAEGRGSFYLISSKTLR
jgi:hypothetical protein